MRSLLDTSVVLALFDQQHADHRRARAWLDQEMAAGWASCAITQNGFIRIMSQPQYPDRLTVAQAIDRLAEATASDHHQFWSCDGSILDPAWIDRTRLHGHRQVTDAYLLALATAHEGRLVTLDQTISLDAVPAASAANLEVI